MDRSKVAAILLVISLALIVFGFAFPWIAGGNLTYGDEEAAEYQRASANLHNELHRHADGHDHGNGESEGSGGTDRLAEARAAYEQAVANRDHHVFLNGLPGLIAKTLGCVGAVVGIVLYSTTRRQA